MTDTLVALEPTAVPAPGFLERITRGAVVDRLAAITQGRLVVNEADERTVFGDVRSPDDPTATIRVLDPRFWSSVALRGSVGAGEAFMDGHWTTDDLPGVMRLMVRNRAALEDLDGGAVRLAMPFLRWFHRVRQNDRDGSRRNISAHYDLGNDFFELFLDETLTYSCGIFATPETTLHEAQLAKLDAICRKLALGPDDHLVEIGTGWGALAIHAATNYGCRVTTTTISERQHEVAARRVAEAGLSDRVTLLLTDYRDLSGTYDKLVSVEMIEAVGFKFLDTYFAKCASLLRPGGKACIQAITIADRFHDAALEGVDFIQRYVFPGSYIPSVGSISASVARATDLRLTHFEDIGPHYATTLRLWRERFLAAEDRVAELGYPEHFRRLWEFYLAYCEGGFAERQISDAHLVYERPAH